MDTSGIVKTSEQAGNAAADNIAQQIITEQARIDACTIEVATALRHFNCLILACVQIQGAQVVSGYKIVPANPIPRQVTLVKG